MESPLETKLWQFASIDRKWGIILSDQAFYLHTASYHDFAGFAERLKAGIIALKGVPDMDIDWVTSVGIRYVNLIAPKEKTKLQEYLQSWVLPGTPPHASLEEIQESVLCVVRLSMENYAYKPCIIPTLHCLLS